MSGPDFHYPRWPIARRRRPMRSRRAKGVRLWLMSLIAVGFVAALVTLMRTPDLGGVAAARAEVSFLRAPSDTLSARFGLCHNGGGRDCVIDGDTFRFAGATYRVADIDTPETHPARCAGEAALGVAATGRLREWLSDGAFSLESAGRDADRYGRRLRIVTRDGTSVGSLLVAEGLARPWEGERRPWCRG